MWIQSSQNFLTGGTHLVFLSDKRNTSKSVCFSDDAAENQWVTVLNKHGATYMSMNLSYYP